MPRDQFQALSSLVSQSLVTTMHAATMDAELVRPSTKRNLPSIVEPIRLRAFDLIMPPINVRIPMVFKIIPASASVPGSILREQFETIVTKLKASLADALELCPPVAGTIHTSPDDASDITIDCDGRGATFMTQVERQSYVESEHTLDGLSGTDLFGMDASKTIFAVKLTLFSCGTIAMVTSMHHFVADLTSYMDFLRIWDRLSGDDTGNLVLPESCNPPPSSGPPPMPALRMFDGLRWFISDASLAQLKTDCMASFSVKDPVRYWISSADAFTALVWGAMTRARHDISTKSALSTNEAHAELESLGVAVDGRERLGLDSPEAGSPTRYFGNLNLSLAVYTPRINLLEATLEATSRIALAIRKTIQDETTLDAIASRVAFIEATRPDTTQRIVLEGDCRSTNWAKHDPTKFDFGLGSEMKSIGTTLATKTIYPAGMFLITRGSGGLLVATTVEEEADVPLSMDPLLTRYAELLSN
ncbi:transferase family-domain-containing protein [Lentinula guzmanii]|uniref:Transferase family-domain-containing protein n=1 Tax=Lentinula guzmanii TaxID=2804957 RepID=A0AA38JXB6_9AGAR|nr:transferase family-domain-containing protein [Lentinula guzmanii]